MSHIFISYSHVDAGYVKRLAEALEQEGFTAWVDDRIDYGTTWTGEVQKRLDACDAFILVMTPTSFESRWVNNELSRAMRKNKPIYPLLLEGEEPWLAVESIQFLDVRGGKLPEERFYKLLSAVVPRSKPEPGLKPEPIPAQEPPAAIKPAEIIIETPAVEETPKPEIKPEPEIKAAERKAKPPAAEKTPTPKIKPKKQAAPRPIKVKPPAGEARSARRNWLMGLGIVFFIALVGVGVWLFRGPLHLFNLPPITTQTSPGGTHSWIPTPLSTVTAGAAPSFTGESISVGNATSVAEVERWGGGGVINQMALNYAGDTVAVATTLGVYLLDPITLEERVYFPYDADVTAIAFTKDGTTLAVGLANGDVQVITLVGTELSKFETTGQVNSLSFDSYGTMLAAGMENGLMVWSMEDGSLVHSEETPGNAVNALLFNWADDLLGVGYSNGEIHLLNVPEGSTVLKTDIPDVAVTSLAFSPDGTKLAVGGWDGWIRGLSLPDGQQIYSFDGHTHHIPCLVYSSDSYVLVSGTGNGGIYFWKPEEQVEPVLTLTGHSAQVRSLAFMPDAGSFLSASLDGTVRKWETESSSAPLDQSAFSSLLQFLSLSPDEKVLAYARYDGVINVQEIYREGFQALKGLPDSYAVGWDREGQTLTSISSSGMGRWDFSDENVEMLVDGFPAEVTSAAFSFLKQEFAVGLTNGNIGYYSADGTLRYQQAAEVGKSPLLLEYNAEGTLLAASYEDGSLVVWQNLDTEPVKLHELQWGWMNDFTFTDDSSNLLMVGEDGMLRKLPMEGPAEAFDVPIEGIDEEVRSMEFNLDRSILALGLSNSIALVNWDELKLLTYLEGHTRWVTDLVFLPDATMLASASEDGTIRWWGVVR